MPAIHAVDDGLQVYVVTDASGGVSAEAHDMAVRRLVQAGVVPVTWGVVQAEFLRDWAREAGVAAQIEAGVVQHAGGSAVAFAWEMQLLNTPAPTTTGV